MSKSKPSGVAAQTLVPYLIVNGAERAIDFYVKAFHARETSRLTGPNGKIGHAELAIGGAMLMLADEHPNFGALSPQSVGGSPVRLHLTVDDTDAVVERAVAAGATVLRPVKDEFYGERTGMILDPFGHAWFIAAHIEDVSADEAQRRYTSALEGR